jgi:hypothetical protein
MTHLNDEIGDVADAGAVAAATGAIGRLMPDDVIGLVELVRQHQAREQAA